MLDGNEKILCAVPSKDIISLYQNLNYHQADTIEASLVLSEKYTSILNNVRYFAISDRESNHNFYLYRKTLVQVQNHEIVINGQGAFWDEMQGAYIKDRRPNQVTPADVIKIILGYSHWNVDFVDQMLEEDSLKRDMNFYYVSLLDALNMVYQTWQVDIEPYINIEGHQITRRYVKLYQQQGGNNGRHFVYGDNALTVTQQANEGSIFTALVGRGAGVEETDESGNLTGGYSRKINFADVEWSKANGDPCDKPAGQEYVEWKESTELYGYSDGKPRIGIVNFDNEKDPEQLLKETWAQLQQVGVPLVQFQATVSDVGYLNLGETVTIVRYDLNIKYQTRVTGIKWNRCDEAKSQITIGVKAIQSTADKIASLQQSIVQANANADEAKSTANHAVIDGTGAVVNYGPNKPANSKEGDIWYDVQPDGTVVLKQYQNGQWVILIDDTTGQQIKNKVDAQQKELDKAVQDANAASAKADELVAQVGDANTNAQKALTTAQQNQADLSQVKNDLTNTRSQLSNVQTDLTSAKSTLAGAVADITQAKNDLSNTKKSIGTVESSLADTQNQLASDEKQMSNLTAEAQKQGQTIVDIQKTQSGLTANVADIKGNISSLQSTANSLRAAVKDNQGSISKLQETANGLESDVADNKNNISVIKQTASSMSSTITNITDGNRTNYLSHTSSESATSTAMANGNVIVSPDRWIGEMGLKQGDTITFSVYIEKAPADCCAELVFYQSNSATWGYLTTVNGNYITSGNSGYSSVTATLSTNVGSLVPVIHSKSGSVDITYSQAEIVIGNTRLPWTACFRDLATTKNISEINQTLDSIKSTVSSNSNDISQIKQTAQKIESDVSDSRENISALKQTATSLQSSISNNAKDISSIKQTATGLESTVSNLTNENWTNYLSHTSSKLSAIILNNQGKATVSSDRYLGDMGLKVGEKITFSAYIENAPDDISVDLQFYQSNSATWGYISDNWGNTIAKGSSGYSSVTVTIPNDAGSLVPIIAGKTPGVTVNYSQAEIVIGNTRLPWVACQRDMATSQDISSINQTINSIKTSVSSNTGDVTQLKQTAQSLQTLAKDNQGNISSLQSTAKSLQSSISNNQNDISSVKQTVNGLQSSVSDNKNDISSLRQSANSLTSQIGNANKDISSLKQRADSIETNISNNKNDISSLKQTAKSLQSNIQSKADISQITQLSNVIQSTVQSIGTIFPNGNFSDNNWKAYWEPWGATKDYANITFDTTTNPPGAFGSISLHSASNSVVQMITRQYIPITPGSNITIGLMSRAYWEGNAPSVMQCRVHLYDTDKSEIRVKSFDLRHDKVSGWYQNNFNITAWGNETSACLEIYVQGNPECWARVSEFSISSGNGNDTLVSQINQMKDDINLRVQKGNLISQINIEAGKTLIQSKNLYLDSDTVTFSGKAFIPSAAITDLSADKITTGTLNAGNVRIINLDANNITTGTISGPNLSINLNTGEILFQRGSIRSTNGNLNVDIDNGTFAETDYQGNGLYFRNGNLYLTSSGIWDTKSSVYGAIVKDDNLIDSATKGMEIVGGQGGIILHTQKYDPNDNWGDGVWGGAGTSGAGVAISDKNNGELLGHAYGKISFATNTSFNNGGYFKQYPNIQIGVTQDSNPQGDRIKIDAHYIHLYGGLPPTTSDSANVCMASDGAILKVTSASKYKKDIERTYETDYGEKLLELPTATWIDKAEAKRSKNPRRYFGMIAEDLADAGLEMLVRRDANGEVDGIEYERLACALIPVVRELKEKINKLEGKIYGK